MKIITGTAKGKTLRTLPSDDTRPTSERIKEAMFSSIQFDIESRRVLDLFAGSGQLGLEALSRGALSCTFIDSSRDAIDIVKANIAHTGFGDQSKTLVSDAANYVRKASGKQIFDLVFIDPPYKLKCATELLLKIERAGILADGALVVIESGEEIIDTDKLTSFEVTKAKQYGKKTALHILLYRKPEVENG